LVVETSKKNELASSAFQRMEKIKTLRIKKKRLEALRMYGPDDKIAGEDKNASSILNNLNFTI
jgi:hypothetical protein